MTTPPAPQDENQIIAERRAKLVELRKAGIAFPNDFRREHLAADLHRDYDAFDNEALQSKAVTVAVAGRMMLKRLMGKANFATLQDMSGRIQLFVNLSDIGAAAIAAFKHWDMGDTLGARGTLFKTKTGELSVRVTELRLLAKALRPLPEKFHGLADAEAKYRQRYVDLITNDEARRTFAIRSRVIQEIRAFMVGKGYLEVETPMMQPLPGGAAAKPFETHHNALDMKLYLRIAPELYLKRLVVGGFEKVFEINRNFRNEGMSTRHNPEFTMIEFYEAYRDYRYLMDFTEEMLRRVAQTVLGSARVPYGEHVVDLDQPFARLRIAEAITRYNPDISSSDLENRDAITALMKRRGVDPTKHHAAGLGALQLLLFEETTEQKLIQPTFIIDYPAEVSPLARRNDANPEITERFELFITGREMANGFSEMNDPEDQAARFEEQARAKAAGDEEAMYYDADYIRALEHGLPPTAGEGIGIDRLVMLLTNSPSIRDVILFPQLRPEA
ncbi:MAG: lysine--tRNA ligase [Betaproteobacteria bacterium RIFCSPLOWO2_02_FULL_62_17]|nr:MAG: lysine--tRNA ligase [Betaproteobacteria bacterium RIFCSPLOWO2_02_FULL_62_17]